MQERKLDFIIRHHWVASAEKGRGGGAQLVRGKTSQPGACDCDDFLWRC